MTLLPFKMITETPTEQWRYSSFWKKEPETIAWIRSFHDGDVFFDIGANIGIYSLYCAAIHPKCNILAFEPHTDNCFRLMDNIKLNGFENVHPFPYCIGGVSGHVDFICDSDEIGSTGGQMHESLGIGECACWSLDDFIIHGFYSPNPNHIKIDIDGQELKIIQGMRYTLTSTTLKSVLIEVDTDKDEIVRIFLGAGFTMDNVFNRMKNHSRVRRAKEGINVENIVFTRN